MFFGNSERKRSSAVPVLLVGALALVGAISITKKGKAILRGCARKMKNIMGRDEPTNMPTEF